MNGFIHHKKSGFTLTELTIVIALIGVMAIVVVPYLGADNFEQDQQKFAGQVNEFVASVWYDTILTGKDHRVVFDLQNAQMFAEIKTGQRASDGEYMYDLVQIDYSKNMFAWDGARFRFKEIFINGKNAMLANDDSDKVWFYITSEGLAQDVIINLIDKKELNAHGETGDISLVLNPFSVQFKLYDAFQKPA